jgi:hypothetical protein
MGIRLLLLFVVAVPQSLTGQTAVRQPEAPRVSVCDLLTEPLKYDGMLVTVRGRWEGTDEGSWLVSDKCNGAFVAAGRVWPSAIFMQSPDSPSRLHSVDFKYDSASERRFTGDNERLQKRVPKACIVWAIVGMFETRAEWFRPRVGDSRVAPTALGFGHLSSAPAQLLMKSVLGVGADPACTEKSGKMGQPGKMGKMGQPELRD